MIDVYLMIGNTVSDGFHAFSERSQFPTLRIEETNPLPIAMNRLGLPKATNIGPNRQYWRYCPSIR
jgi:hypothetical protein